LNGVGIFPINQLDELVEAGMGLTTG
jgi:hypothetical protein